ncbi:MAG: DUF2207 domain-containing protein [Patescibacteria group bacterium]
MYTKLKSVFLFAVLTYLFVFKTTTISAESITKFNTLVSVNKDGSIKVVEQIYYDLGFERKHGIYRDILTIRKNNEGKKYRIDIFIDSVTNLSGAKYNYTTSSITDNKLRIKIGDPNTYVTGENVYVISYTAKGALTYFSDHDELYWNMTGNDWDVPINQASFTVNLPSNIPSTKIQKACFTGSIGSAVQNCTVESENNHIIGKTTVSLFPKEGLTGVIGFPIGYVAILEAKEVVSFTDTLIGKVLLLLLGIMALVWYVLLPGAVPIWWYMKGRDPRGDIGEVRAWFDPPQTKDGRLLTPSETGMLVDESVDMRDIFACVIDMARRGYYKIIEKKKGDFYFVRNGKSDGALQPFEKEIYDGLFKSTKTEIRLKDTKLVAYIEKAQGLIYESMTKNGFFPKNPNTVRTIWYALGFVALITSNFFLGIVSFVFARVMPRKTVFGAGQANIGKSLKNFLGSQKRQLEFQAKNLPVGRQGQMFFEKLLPYAVAFGVEKVWAERFKDIDLRQPDWYQGYDNRAFTTAYLVNSMHSSFTNFRSSATPVRSSTGHSSGFGGGGFSGGGGGGGGGGSW